MSYRQISGHLDENIQKTLSQIYSDMTMCLADAPHNHWLVNTESLPKHGEAWSTLSHLSLQSRTLPTRSYIVVKSLHI